MKKHRYNLIKELLAKPENELYLELGMELSEKSLEYSPKNLIETIEKGKKKLGELSNVIKEIICGNEYITMLASSKSYEDKVMLVSAISDLIASIVIGVSPFTVAALLVKHGVPTFCK